MKKLLVALVIIFTLALSGCGEDGETVSESRCGENGTWVSTTLTPSNEGYCSYDGVYYTQEEVDAMFEEYLTEYAFESWLQDQQQDIDDMFVDYGLDVHSVEDFVNLVDDLEDRVWELELRIDELEQYLPLNETIVVESENFTFTVTFEDGVITFQEVCGTICEPGGIIVEDWDRFYIYQRDDIINDFEVYLAFLEAAQ